ncbi:serine/threonine-protein kinase [Limnoglobus roseus]|uniref:Serine/threonine protein kinase n=1 Tax=Limnoglobus roseus TaxID=2598579 RepID=A0A5C1ASA8_9BACT|nr:serine/threonine-protein kinase [Limnoglobus roseus]QEL20114.1 serine/threonine protein kinase [Limnoglobus roseus]
MNSSADAREPLEPFLEAIRRSRLVTDERAAELARTTDPDTDATELADQLVSIGELTRFQADKLLAGQPGGLILGKYRILAPLGRGGMGVVYLTRENTDAANVTRPLMALKILSPKKAVEPRTRDRFLREMAIGRVIPNHRNVTRMYAAGEVNGVSYIAMEYAPGRTIKEIVAEDGPMPPGEAARVFAEIADGLAAMHNAGLIHRDIKPANIIITPDGTAKLIDFGFALHIGDELPRDPSLIGGKGYILGSMDYIAPEQATDATDVSPRSDLYALGASLYFALSGCPPFPGGTALQKIRWHRNDSPPPIRTLCPGLPLELAVVVSKLMAKDPEERFASAVHVAEVLRQWATPVAKHDDTVATDEHELSTDELWIDPRRDLRDDSDSREGRREPDEELTVAVPMWVIWAVLVAVGLSFVLGFAFGLLNR